MAIHGSGLLKLVVENLELHEPTGPMVWDTAIWSREFAGGDPAAAHLHRIEQRAQDTQAVWELADVAAKRRGTDRIDAVVGLFVWSQVSVLGMDVAGPGRLRATMEKLSFEDHLLRVYDVLLNEGPIAAHAMLVGGSSGGFADLSQGLATSFLFFAGYGAVCLSTEKLTTSIIEKLTTPSLSISAVS